MLSDIPVTTANCILQCVCQRGYNSRAFPRVGIEACHITECPKPFDTVFAFRIQQLISSYEKTFLELEIIWMLDSDLKFARWRI